AGARAVIPATASAPVIAKTIAIPLTTSPSSWGRCSALTANIEDCCIACSPTRGHLNLHGKDVQLSPPHAANSAPQSISAGGPLTAVGSGKLACPPPLLALSGHARRVGRCPVLGVRVQLVTATLLVVYRQGFRSPRSSAGVD